MHLRIRISYNILLTAENTIKYRNEHSITHMHIDWENDDNCVHRTHYSFEARS